MFVCAYAKRIMFVQCGVYILTFIYVLYNVDGQLAGGICQQRTQTALGERK